MDNATASAAAAAAAASATSSTPAAAPAAHRDTTRPYAPPAVGQPATPKPASATSDRLHSPRPPYPASTSPSPPLPHDHLPHLPKDLICTALEFLPPNEIPLTARLICTDARHRFRSARHRTARISLPVPAHAADWPVPGPADPASPLHRLSLRRKILTMTAAVASGSETNLGIAWRCLRDGCLFSELLHTPGAYEWDNQREADPGVTAARLRHTHLLPWLVHHRVPLLTHRTLAAVAQHCDLAALRSAWDLLQPTDSTDPRCATQVLASAASSSTPDALDKLAWLLQQPGCVLTVSVAAAAVESGEGVALGRLQWLLERGCPLATDGARAVVLAAALRHTPGMEVAEWVLRHSGCPKPEDMTQEEQRTLYRDAAAGGEVHKLRWLRARGVEVHGVAIQDAARCGWLEAVRFMHEECGQQLSSEVFLLGVKSGCMQLVEWLRGRGCPYDASAYRAAAMEGNLPMVHWLLHVAACPASHLAAGQVTRWWPRGDPGGCRTAVEVLAGGGVAVSGHHTLAEAVHRGDLELVEFVHQRGGAEFDHNTLYYAVQGGCEAVIEWLVEKGCRPQPDWGFGAAQTYARAARQGDKGTLVCLRRLGVEWNGRTLRQALLMGTALAVLRWLVEQRVPLEVQELSAMLQHAVAMGRAEVVAWMRGAGLVGQGAGAGQEQQQVPAGGGAGAGVGQEVQGMMEQEGQADAAGP